MDLPETDALNALSPADFAASLAPLFEGAHRFLQRLAAARPFATDGDLLAAAREVAAAAPENELIELLDAHPRIGADVAEMSDLSRGEQEDGAAVGAALAQELGDLNVAYERIFGFRYVVFVAGRPRAAIVPLMEVALRNARVAELRRGVEDAIYIASDRLRVLRDASDETEVSGP